MEKNIKGRKTVIIAGIIAIVAIIAVVIGIVQTKNTSSTNNKTYRAIKVAEISGNVMISNKDGESYNASTNMNLVSGDRISTGADSFVVIKADKDKYMRLAENSAMVLTASGSEKNSKTTIELEDGSVLNEIQEHLSDDSTYDVKTPGATMSVRGTVYNVTYNSQTKESGLYVYDGVVNCKDAEGKEDDYQKGEFTQFVVKDDGRVEYIVEKGQITEDMIDPQIKNWLDEIQDEGREVTYLEKSEDDATDNTQELENIQTENTKIVKENKKETQNQEDTNVIEQSATSSATTPENINNNVEDNSENTDNSSENNSSEDGSNEIGDLYLHMSNPVLLAKTGTETKPLTCTVTEDKCLIEGIYTVTAPTEYWGFGKTYVKGSVVAPPYTTTPTVNTADYFEVTPQFQSWKNIGNTELAKTDQFRLNKSDTYYAAWNVDGTNYYSVEIHFGTKTYVFSVQNGTVLQINERAPESIYTNTSITVE